MEYRITAAAACGVDFSGLFGQRGSFPCCPRHFVDRHPLALLASPDHERNTVQFSNLNRSVEQCRSRAAQRFYPFPKKPENAHVFRTRSRLALSVETPSSCRVAWYFSALCVKNIPKGSTFCCYYCSVPVFTRSLYLDILHICMPPPPKHDVHVMMGGGGGGTEET